MLILPLLAAGLLLADRVDAVEPATPPTIQERAGVLTRHDGFVPYYWDARKGQLLLEIARWNEDVLYGAGLAGGAGILELSLDRGELGALSLCRFERVGPRVLLHQKQTRQRSGVADAERTRVVTESFPTSVLASLPIVAEEGDRVLVDATEFLLRDTWIAAALKKAGQGEWKQDVARSAVHLERTGAFPINTELEATLTFACDGAPAAFDAVLPDGRTMSLRLHHTFLSLPRPGFEPLPLDPRAGFIPLAFNEHTAPIDEPLERHFAYRWRLAKKDPAAKVSEPVQPIVYYLDRGIPEPERTAVRESALWWNHAFQEAGLKDALVIKDLPEGATFLDARYSGIEWISRAERGWSVGDSQADPRTGEILHAVARIDSHRRRTTSRMWLNMKAPARACLSGSSPDLAWLARGEPSIGEETLMLQRLAYLSAHEVGHTLGLEHNFAATTFGWGSVMDYLAANIQLKGGRLDLSDAFPKDIGAYDHFLIRWGYTPGLDAAARAALVRDALAQGVVYPHDSDPRWAEYDWGADPVSWLRTTLAVRKVILSRFGVDQLKPGEPVYALQARFSLAYLYHRFGIQAAQQYVGGMYQTNAVAGDGQKPTAWVAASKQKEALDLLVESLAPENLDIPEPVVGALVGPPSATNPTRERFASEAGDTFSPLSAARSLCRLIVSPLLDPQRTARLALASGADALTLDAALRRLVSATWGASPAADRTEHLASLRRVAQRSVLDGLMELASRVETSPEARAAAMSRLVALKGELRAKKSTNAAAESHLRLAERDLTEFLDKPEVRKQRPAPFPVPPGRPIGSE